jgi:two-component system CheB/CheR fusion protein
MAERPAKPNKELKSITKKSGAAIVKAVKSKSFPIVAIGGSAGSFASFEKFFQPFADRQRDGLCADLTPGPTA